MYQYQYLYWYRLGICVKKRIVFLADDDNAIAPLESLFKYSYGVSHIQMLRRIPMGIFADIEHIYTPFLIAVLEFETIIHERGWFDL